MLTYQKFCFLLFLILSPLLYPFQNQRDLDIDKLLELSDATIFVDFEKSLSSAKMALSMAEQSDNSQKRAESYFYIAKSLIFFRKFDECFPYLEKGLQEKACQNDIILKASFLGLQSTYYSRMSLFEQAYQKNLEVLKLLKSRHDLESQLIKSNMYIGIADYYTELSNYKMAHHYADISIAISEKIDLKDYLSAKHIYRYRAFIYFYKSWIFLEENKPDSAYSFIQKAYDQAIFEKYKFLAPFYETYGDYYFKVHNFKKAVSFYLKCLENKHKFRQNAANVNAKISKTYKLLGDREKEIYYLQKAESMRTLDSKSDSKIVQEELNRTLVKKQTEENKLMKNNTLFIVFIILFFTVFLVTIIVHERRIKNKKSEIISAQKIIIHKKESEIKEREQKIGELQKKVTDALPELIDLVKNNSPYFFGRFQEVYPEFCLKMLEINPMLKSSELTFCAYIYLGISTKEIAKYTFKSGKTIENNRYNIRKRLNLQSQEDLMVWIRMYIDGA